MQTKTEQEQNSLCLHQTSDLVNCERISNPSVSSQMASNYNLCQDIIKIANNYLSNQDPLQYYNKDRRDMMIESENLLKSLTGRIFQNIFPGASSFQNKEEGFSSFGRLENDSSKLDSSPLLVSDENEISDDEIKVMNKSKKISQKTSKTKEKLENPCSLQQRRKKDYWTPEEDAQLLHLLKNLGKKWTKIGNIIGGRTGKQVRDRFLNKLRPDITEEDWTEEEDNKFLSLYQKFGKRWCQIADFMQGRTENQVKNRFYSKIVKNLKSNSGSQESPTPKSFQGSYYDETFSVFETQDNEKRNKTIENAFSKDLAFEYIDPQEFFCNWENQMGTYKDNINKSGSDVDDFF